MIIKESMLVVPFRRFWKHFFETKLPPSYSEVYSGVKPKKRSNCTKILDAFIFSSYSKTDFEGIHVKKVHIEYINEKLPIFITLNILYLFFIMLQLVVRSNYFENMA